MKKTALLFAGQGSQIQKMGEDIAQSDAQCMEFWEKAEEFSAMPLRTIYWEKCIEEEMLKTNTLQPALTAVALSLVHIYKKNNHYEATAGHSLGEFPALYSAGVLSAEDVLFLVAQRGKLMHTADPEGKGSMLAVLKLPLEKVQEIVATVRENYGEGIYIANYNTPSQCILSGEKRLFPHVTELVNENKGRIVHFAIGGAFHSPMMQQAEDSFVQYLDAVIWNNATVPIYTNVTASPLTNAQEIKMAVQRQITSPVRFVEILQSMQANGINNFVELCAKSVCTPFVKATLGSDVNFNAISTIEQLQEG